ncbi:MAG: hypothetical protein M1815_005358 [Lichina confinis]|nr:MAG: hypothetical protein M1815_005358 [Lichina confinis]
MSSDADYAAFLGQANQDTGAAKTSSSEDKQSGGFASTKAVDTDDVPGALKAVDMVYTSESDEPFEPVSLQCDASKGWPDEKQFLSLIDHPGKDAQVSILAPDEFDPKDRYGEVMQAVQAAVGGGRGADGDKVPVKVYQVTHDKTRAEYYVVALDKKGSRIMGLKARSVET